MCGGKHPHAMPWTMPRGLLAVYRPASSTNAEAPGHDWTEPVWAAPNHLKGWCLSGPVYLAFGLDRSQLPCGWHLGLAAVCSCMWTARIMGAPRPPPDHPKVPVWSHSKSMSTKGIFLVFKNLDTRFDSYMMYHILPEDMVVSLQVVAGDNLGLQLISGQHKPGENGCFGIIHFPSQPPFLTGSHLPKSPGVSQLGAGNPNWGGQWSPYDSPFFTSTLWGKLAWQTVNGPRLLKHLLRDLKKSKWIFFCISSSQVSNIMGQKLII